MVEIAARPMMIEAPIYTADDVRWESYEELAAFLAKHAEAGAEPEIFRNERGEWVRWWPMDDPDVKRINPETGALESRRYFVQRRVALSQEEATRILRQARLALALATRQVLQNALSILGVSQPVSM